MPRATGSFHLGTRRPGMTQAPGRLHRRNRPTSRKAGPMSTVELTESTFEETVREGIVLVDFWAAWCGPCRQFAPVFEKASGEHTDITFGKIDTEAEQGLAAAAGITSIPTLMAFRDGILVFAQPGGPARHRARAGDHRSPRPRHGGGPGPGRAGAGGPLRDPGLPGRLTLRSASARRCGAPRRGVPLDAGAAPVDDLNHLGRAAVSGAGGAVSDSQVDLMPACTTSTPPSLWGYCLRLTGATRRAEDVVQETLLRAWRHPSVLDQSRRRSAPGCSPWPATSSSTSGEPAARAGAEAPRRCPRPPTGDHTDHLLQRWVVADAITPLSEDHREGAARVLLPRPVRSPRPRDGSAS